MSIYGLQKTLVAARFSARTVGERADSIKSAAASGGGANAHVDSLAAHVALLRSEVDRVLLASSGLIRPIESFPTLPSTDQHQQFTWAFDDATHAITELNHVMQSELPSVYSQYMHRPWPKIDGDGAARKQVAPTVIIPRPLRPLPPLRSAATDRVALSHQVILNSVSLSS